MIRAICQLLVAQVILVISRFGFFATFALPLTNYYHLLIIIILEINAI